MVLLRHQTEQLEYKNMQAEASASPLNWMPALEERKVRPVESTIKIRKLKAPIAKHPDIVTKLRKTWIGWVYTKHLKQYALVRWTFQWLWRIGYPIYVKHIYASLLFNSTKRRAIRWRPLITLRQFTQKRGTPIFKLADAAEVETPEPKVFPSCDQDYLISPHDRFKFPEIYVTTMNSGMVYGGSNLILADDRVVCHDLFNFERDFTSEELHGRALIDPKSRRIRWLLHDEKPERIPTAATFVDACASNYAHWLTEVFPRVAVFCADERFKDIPIVINSGLHQNIMESLSLVTGSEREVIMLPIGRGLHCDKLYITSASGYVPFEWRKTKRSDCSHGVFSPPVFNMLRTHLHDQVKNSEVQAWPKRIFLRRNSEYRKVVNAIEVEKLFISHGYVVVEPEKLTFLQQVALFNNAKSIVSSTGAALANIIFAQQGSKISILISKHPDTIYWYWQNIACATGKAVNYVFGKISDRQVNGIHASFFVDLNDLESLISELELELGDSTQHRHHCSILDNNGLQSRNGQPDRVKI